MAVVVIVWAALIDVPCYFHGQAADLAQLVGRPPWHPRGLCHGKTATFFSVAPANVETAKAICAVCRLL